MMTVCHMLTLSLMEPRVGEATESEFVLLCNVHCPSKGVGMDGGGLFMV